MNLTGTKNKLITHLLELDNEQIYDCKITKHKEKRSLSMNAYAWQLINKIAEKRQLKERIAFSKEEIYEQMIHSYSPSEVISMLSEIDIKGYFKYYKQIGSSVLNNKEFTHYRIFKGSSELNIEEMIFFIDGIIRECHELGIETMTPNELHELKEMEKSK